MHNREIIVGKSGAFLLADKHLIEVEIPFDGFYDSFISEDIDSELENEFGEAAWSMNIPYKAIRTDICKAWVAKWNELVTEETGIPCDATFSIFSSPREYNFHSDRLFVMMNLTTIHRLAEWVGPEALQEQFTKSFTSCSGFTSFYDTQVPDEPIHEWDQPLISEIMNAVAHKMYPDGDAIAKIYFAMDDGQISNAVYAHVPTQAKD